MDSGIGSRDTALLDCTRSLYAPQPAPARLIASIEPGCGPPPAALPSPQAFRSPIATGVTANGLRRDAGDAHPEPPRRHPRHHREEDVRRPGVPGVWQHGHRRQRAGRALVRVDPARSDELVASTGAAVAEMRGRLMPGWLRVDSSDLASDTQLTFWVDLGTGYARSLPPMLYPAPQSRFAAPSRRLPCGRFAPSRR